MPDRIEMRIDSPLILQVALYMVIFYICFMSILLPVSLLVVLLFLENEKHLICCRSSTQGLQRYTVLEKTQMAIKVNHCL